MAEHSSEKAGWQSAVDALKENAEEDRQELLLELRQVRKELEWHQQQCRWEGELRADFKDCEARLQAGVFTKNISLLWQ